MSIQAELFTKDLEQFHTEQKHYLDASGNFLGYNANHGIKPLKPEEHIKIQFDEKMFYKGSGSAVDDPTCSMSDPTLKGEGCFVGLSNLNFGHITNPVEFGGTMIQDLEEWKDLKWSNPLKKQSEEPVLAMLGITKPFDLSFTMGNQINHTEFLLKGELTGPLIEAQEEQGLEEEETQWHCKGCSKYFATKASLKRHHDRKKSCKELCEKHDISGNVLEVPDKPYILEWVDKVLATAISGDQSEKPYCKHCDIEFANKSNLSKHLSKSVACDKLAKQEFMSLIASKSL